ncbi:MAG TPA: radical SAM protein, partial [Desulfobacterales bacterium]|nr:radical SAM protein [Desulfobacterales bacterium]
MHHKNGYHPPRLNPQNINNFYSLATAVTHNGIYLYQYLLRSGFDPIVVQNFSLADISRLLAQRPLAVCISSNFILMNEIMEIARQIKSISPEVHVIAGGMLVKKVLNSGKDLPDDAIAYYSSFNGVVDAFVIESHGEKTLVQLLAKLYQEKEIDSVPNLALFDQSGQIFFTPRQVEEIHMDETAIDWSEIPRQYLGAVLPVNTSRGCFYRCKFCTYHWLFPKVNYKSIHVLREELRSIEDLGFVRHVRFTDDNFTANRQRLQKVLKMIMEEGFTFTWSCFARAGALDPDLVALMKKAGCEFVDMGLESGSQKMLDLMDKKLKLADAFEAIRHLNENGIWSRGSFIVGYPGETMDTFSQTIDFINQSGLPYYHPYLFYYSKNTLVHKEREQFALQGLGLVWRHATMDSVKASALIPRMVVEIQKGYTDGMTYIEEIYKFLRGKGYSGERILELFKLKRELQLALANGPVNGRAREILD